MTELFGYRVGPDQRPLGRDEGESLLRALSEGWAGIDRSGSHAASLLRVEPRFGWGCLGSRPFERQFENGGLVVLGGEPAPDAEVRGVGSKPSGRGHGTEGKILPGFSTSTRELAAGFEGKFAVVRAESGGRVFELARDSFGLQPFFVLAAGKALLFSTAIRGFRSLSLGRLLSEKVLEEDPDGLAQYLALQLTLGETTLFRRVRRLLPGRVYSVETQRNLPVPGPAFGWEPGVSNFEGEGNQEEIEARLRGAIQESVASSTVGAFPLGALVSGGLDSSTVACLAGCRPGIRLATFTGYYGEGPEFDERPYAKAVASAVGSRHEEILIRAQDFSDHLEETLNVLDQPMAGPGAVGQLIVARFMKGRVSRVLTGEGGDELFGGYARILLAHGLEIGLGEDALVRALGPLGDYRLLVNRVLLDPPGGRGDRGVGFVEEAYARLLQRQLGTESIWSPDLLETLRAADVEGQILAHLSSRPEASPTGRILGFERRSLLPVLLELDHLILASVGIEGACPLLVSPVAELLEWIGPEDLLGSSSWGEEVGGGLTIKPWLRRVAKEFLPRAVVDRRDKKGFPLPLQRWAQGPLKERFREVLLDRDVREGGIFRPSELEKLLETEQLYGRGLWGALSLALWRRSF